MESLIWSVHWNHDVYKRLLIHDSSSVGGLKIGTGFEFVMPFSHTNNFLGRNLCMTSLIVLSLDDRELLIVDSFKSTKNINKGSKARQPIYKSL